jgi:NADH dehydrogenase [ubiquinone] 1 alpha subcomplex assembly factor 7
MTKLSDIIAARIAHDGPMDVGTFMALALAHPQHGYYTTRDPIGAAGDFTTAPEISQMFGELIGAWAADLWHRMGSPPSFVLAEAGPGHGTLMADALRATRSVPGFHRAMQLHLLEVSDTLKERQARALADYRPLWHTTMDSLMYAGAVPIILIANEFFDALPVRQLQRDKGGWMERRVGADGQGGFAFGLAPAPEDLMAMVPPRIGHLARDGDVFEPSPARSHVMARLCNGLHRRGGAALIVDYGHAEAGLGDTLQALKNHAYVSIFETPGEADLTSHVDFEVLAAEAVKASCTAFGPAEQGAFLNALGIGPRAQKLGADAQAALQRLTDPKQMGRLFKVMAVTAGHRVVPAGF